MTRRVRASAALAGLLTVATLVPSGVEPAGVAVAGVVALVAGAARERRGVVDLGGAVLLLGVVVAGSRGHAADLLVMATVGAVVAWDAAGHAVGLATQLDSDAETGRGEAVHIGLTLLSTGAIATLALLTYTSGGQVPLVAGLLVAAGAVLVAAGLAPSRAE
jgi:hypothetical protein